MEMEVMEVEVEAETAGHRSHAKGLHVACWAAGICSALSVGR